MAVLNMKECAGYLYFDREECIAEGAKRAAEYQSALPFPHIVIDDFIESDLLRKLVGEFPSRVGRNYFDRPQERYKFQFDPNTVASGRVRNLFAELNGEPFLAFLDAMTGITGLVSDPYFSGGGLHETLQGGHLSVHADFNIHGITSLERRLNLLVYLNDDWSLDYGGELELWGVEMRGPAKSVSPVMGRAVIFNTTSNSYHGQPNPLTCPDGRSRRSIATYYYKALPTESSMAKRTTTFQTRPGSGDRTDWQVRYDHFVADWVPARLQRYAKRLIRRGSFTRREG